MGKLRLFVAVDLGAAIERRIGQELARLVRRAPDAKWVQTAMMHVTLAFLGYQDEERVALITAALTDVAARHRPVALRARGAGGFGSSKRPRVLWTDLTGDVEALAALQADVVRALVPLGYEPEDRPFRAHLTLARSRAPSGEPGFVACIDALKDVDFGETTIDEILLFKSELSPRGATYTVLSRAPLGA